MNELHQKILGYFRQVQLFNLRTFLTLLGMVLGSASLVTMLTVGKGTQDKIDEVVRGIGENLIHVNPLIQVGSNGGATNSQSSGLSRQDALNLGLILEMEVSYRAKMNVIVNNLNFSQTMPKVYAVSPNLIAIHEIEVVEGRKLVIEDYTMGHRVAVVTKDISHQIKKVRKIPTVVGQTIRLNQSYFTIVGIIKSRADRSGNEGGPLSYQRSILVPDNVAFGQIHEPALYNELDLVTVAAGDMNRAEYARRIIFGMIKRWHEGVEDFEIIASHEIATQKQEAQSILNLVFSLIASISIVIGGVGVMNAMLATVRERFREIGLRRAIGAKRRDIRNQIFFESSCVCGLGGLLGILMGNLIAVGASYTMDIPFSFSVSAIWTIFITSILSALIFGFMPARYASNIQPIEALKNE